MRRFVPALFLAALAGLATFAEAGGGRYPGPQGGSGGGAAQTPWTGDIDGGGKSLTNAATVSAADLAATDDLTVGDDLTVTGDALLGSEYLGIVDPAVAGGRLTISSTDPTATSDTPSATLYYLPYTSTKIALLELVQDSWQLHDISSSGVSLSVTGLTADQLYDIFLYSSSGTLTMEAVVWNSHAAGTSARVAANQPVRRDGAWVRTNSFGKRYLGTIRTVDDGGTVKCKDALHFRLIWNVQNRVPVRDYDDEDTASWTVSSTNGTWGGINSADSTWKFEFVVGLADQPVAASVGLSGATNTTSPSTAVALNGTTPDRTKTTFANYYDAATSTFTTCFFASLVPAGYGYVQGVETSSNSGGTQGGFIASTTAGGGTGAAQAGMTYTGER